MGQPGNRAPRGPAGRVALCLVALLVWLTGAHGFPAFASDERAHHVVVLGDPHLPGRHLPAKQAVLRTINGWTDVDRVVVLGDICEDRGTAEEYAFARQFFAALTAPTHFLVGNHDYIYEDGTTARGGRIRGSPSSRAEKLRRFREAFGLNEVYSSRRVGNYLLVFLSTDHLLSPHLTQISARQLEWLRAELHRRSATPTVIFFHAPLRGTLLEFNDRVNKDDYVAQPQAELRELLLENRQVFLWVAGHMHVSATNESFRSPINRFEAQVATVHVADMQRARIWSTSLFLFSDRVVVKTFDHKQRAWVAELERTVTPGRH
jgi:3',5'-cyclic AMP phosphodiesterase CpdA